jgi:hypothetical protein
MRDVRRKNGTQGLKLMKGVNSKFSFPAIAARSSSSASTRLMFAGPNPIQRETSNLLWPDAAAAGGAKGGGRHFVTSSTDQRLWHGRVDRDQSAVNSLAGKRMVKIQQMRWSLHGAHMLTQVGTADLNGELRDRLRAPFRQPEPNAPPRFKPKPPLSRAA